MGNKLDEFLQKNGHFNLDELNEKLKETCKEWCNSLSQYSEFDVVSDKAELNSKFYEIIGDDAKATYTSQEVDILIFKDKLPRVFLGIGYNADGTDKSLVLDVGLIKVPHKLAMGIGLGTERDAMIKSFTSHKGNNITEDSFITDTLDEAIISLKKD